MNIHTLLTSVHARLDSLSETKSVYQKTLSPDFNPLEVLGLSENTMSLAIAFLLNPNASHGQGGAFLQAFIERLNVGWELGALDKIRVRTEAATDRIESAKRRIDLLVEGTTFILAIENKFWAADQTHQLSDYTEHVSRLAGIQKHYCIVYLTPNGANPSDSSMATEVQKLQTESNKFQKLSYTSFISDWLIDCKKVSQSPRVWSFLSDLMNFIGKTFVGVANMEEKEIVKVATNSAESVSSALKIAFAADGIKTELLSRLKMQLDLVLPQGALEWDLTHQSKSAGLAIKHPSIAGLKFQLKFLAGRYNWLMYGILIPKEFYAPSIDVIALRKITSTALGKNQGGDEWIWCHAATNNEQTFPLDTDWSNNERPWNMIVSGDLAKAILRARDQLFSLVEKSLTSGAEYPEIEDTVKSPTAP